MGSFSGPTTKTKTQETAVSTPDTPAYAQPAVKDYYSQVGALGAQLGQNPSMFATPANSTQLAGIQAANNLGGWRSGLSNSSSMATKAANTTVKPTTAASLLDVPINRYLNPVTEQLVDTSLAAFDDDAGRRQAAFAAQGAQNGAFGGSRYGIAEAQFGADATRERSLLDSQLRSSAFDRATGLASTDTANRQDTGQFNANLQRQQLADRIAAAQVIGNNATSGGSLAQGDAAAQLAAGNAQRAIDQQNALAPLTGLAAYGGLLDPALLAALTGQTINTTGTGTSKTSGGLLQGLLGGVAGGLGTALGNKINF